MDMGEKDTVVRFDLPLPMDAVGNILGAFAAMYLGSTVANQYSGLAINLNERTFDPDALADL